MSEITIFPTRTANCEQHGEFESRNVLGQVWTKCPTCSQIQSDRAKAEDEAKDRERKLQAFQSKIGGSGIPDRFMDRTLENYVAEIPEQQRALKLAKAYAERFDAVAKNGTCMLFCGKPGTGKTHLSAAIAVHLLKQNRTVLFTTIMRAIRRIKDTWSRAARESESEAIAALTSPELLILDEIGVQFGSETEKLLMFEIINTRYEAKRPTILLSNLSAGELREFLTERIWDRLSEHNGQVVTFTWASHRK